MGSSERNAIPLFVTRPAIEPLIAEVADRQRAVLESGRYILGPEVEGFEAEFGEYVGRRHCVGVASGTDALTISLRALDVGAGDEVVVPAYTFFATAEAVVNAGARPVFCDIDADTHCMTAATAEAAIGVRTRALLPVHLFGNPAPMDELMQLAAERGLAVVEDAAQAAGASLGDGMAGSFGDAAAFSFYPGKNLGAFGDAGAIVTDREEIAARARRLRDHGSERRWLHLEVGYNSRLDELQATALRVLLPHLDEWTERRRAAAVGYAEAGLDRFVTLPETTTNAEPAYHLYVIRADDRDALAEAARTAGVETRAYYTPPLHRQPAVERFSDGRSFPRAESAADECLALPMGPALDKADIERVVTAISEATSTRFRA
jgi:dTDP-3-amino-3,4,6-trideoxy-alpha-D-glucose transaminase